MSATLYLLRSDACPDFGPDAREIVVTDDETPLPDNSSEIYSCMTTLVTNYDDSPEFRLAVNEWWCDLCGVDPVLEVLATEVSLMAPNQRNALAELVPESWSVRAIVQ